MEDKRGPKPQQNQGNEEDMNVADIETALRQSEDRFSKIFKYSNDAVRH